MTAIGRRSTDPTIYDVAELAGVSTATVSRALNGTGRVAAATRAAIDEAIADLGYLPNTLARSLVTKTTNTIALLLPDITNPFYPALVKGVQDRAHRRGYLMMLCTAEGDVAGEEAYLDVLRRKRIDGALVDGLVLSKERIAEYVDDTFPIVSLDRAIDDPAIPLVQVDNRAGGRLATEHLLELGHRRIAHLYGTEGLRISEERFAGYSDALEAAGVDLDERLVVVTGFGDEEGRIGAERLLGSRPQPTAIFAANDLAAVGALGAIADAGRRVPEDVSVVGFDDIPLARHVGLTTVRQPAYDIGARAADALLDAIKARRRPRRGRRIVLEPELVVRRTTAKARAAARRP